MIDSPKNKTLESFNIGTVNYQDLPSIYSDVHLRKSPGLGEFIISGAQGSGSLRPFILNAWSIGISPRTLRAGVLSSSSKK